MCKNLERTLKTNFPHTPGFLEFPRGFLSFFGSPARLNRASDFDILMRGVLLLFCFSPGERGVITLAIEKDALSFLW